MIDTPSQAPQAASGDEVSEMVHRVADAMMNADWGSERPTPEDAKIKNYYRMARAAIEAMREPTHAVVVAGLQTDAEQFRSSTPVRAIWNAMIDEALK